MKLFCLAIIFLLLSAGSTTGQERLQQYAPENFMVGGVLHGYADSLDSAEYRSVAELEFNAVTATTYLPWGAWPDPRQAPDTGGLTRVVDWATQSGKRVHGHVLVYPDANKSCQWWNEVPDRLVAPKMTEFIQAMAGARPGGVYVWDVVNEVMAEDQHPMDGLGLRTDYKEYRAMGPGYVEHAFQTARASDPDAVLIINDYGISEWNRKSDRLFNYLIALRERGVPVDGVGFQMHFTDVNQAAPNIDSISRNFQRFASAGFKLFITELDVCAIHTFDPHPNHPGVSTPNDQQLGRQRIFYEQILTMALAQPGCEAFLMWDYADDFSWLHKSDRQIGTVAPGMYTYPTPFWCGKHCPIARKPAFYGMLEALKTNAVLHGNLETENGSGR